MSKYTKLQDQTAFLASKLKLVETHIATGKLPILNTTLCDAEGLYYGRRLTCQPPAEVIIAKKVFLSLMEYWLRGAVEDGQAKLNAIEELLT